MPDILEDAEWFHSVTEPLRPSVRALSDTFIAAAKEAPRGALLHARIYMRYVLEEDQSKVIIEAAAAAPGIALRSVNSYKDYLSKEELSKVLVAAAQEKPGMMLQWIKLQRVNLLQHVHDTMATDTVHTTTVWADLCSLSCAKCCSAV